MSEWGLIVQKGIEGQKLEEPPEWIKFLNETITEGLQFEFTPSLSDFNSTYQVYFILNEIRDEYPQSARFEFSIEVTGEHLNSTEASSNFTFTQAEKNARAQNQQ